MTLREYLKRAFRWEPGRQGTGYDKLLLVTGTWPIPFDCYLIKYPVGSEIPPHVDPVDNFKHYRLNIIVKRSLRGGKFICKDPIFATRRIKFFRPDISEHSVTRVEGSSRYIFSVGFVRHK